MPSKKSFIVPKTNKASRNDFRIDYGLPPGLSDFETAQYIKTPLSNLRLQSHIDRSRSRFASDHDSDRQERMLQSRVVAGYKPELDLLRAHQSRPPRPPSARIRGPNKKGNEERRAREHDIRRRAAFAKKHLADIANDKRSRDRAARMQVALAKKRVADKRTASKTAVKKAHKTGLLGKLRRIR